MAVMINVDYAKLYAARGATIDAKLFLAFANIAVTDATIAATAAKIVLPFT